MFCNLIGSKEVFLTIHLLIILHGTDSIDIVFVTENSDFMTQ